MLLIDSNICESDIDISKMSWGDGSSCSPKSSCLKNVQSTNLMIEDCDLKEHSDDEWYPPTPPLYDVTDKLR